MKKFIKFIRNGIRNERGSVFLIIGLSFASMAGIVATSIDYARGSYLNSELISALDSAALAGGTVANSPNLNAVVTKYFNVNLPTGYMSATVDPLTITLAADKSTLTVGAAAHMKNSMMQIVKWNMTNVSSSTQVTIEKKGMELVLVLDNTGSMSDPAGGGQTKLQALQSAGNSLLNILYGTHSTLPNFWVGVVPFSDAVNIGTGYTSWLDTVYDANLKWGTTSWGGCVEARTNGSASPQYDISDDPPSVKLFRQYYSPCSTGASTNPSYPNKWYGNNSSHNDCTTGSGGSISAQNGLNTTTLGPNIYCPRAVQPMVAEKATIVTALNNMQAVGGTHIDLGLAWGWRMLSPRWRADTSGTSLWGGEMATADVNGQHLPLDYHTALMNKVVILITDGDNTLYGKNTLGTAPAYNGLYTAYGNPANNWLSVTGTECNSSSDCTNGQNEMDNRTTAACAAMKAQGIIIYTIALGTDIDSSSKTLLQGCASNPAYYFESPTGAALQTAFTTIGDSLSNLRISQ